MSLTLSIYDKLGKPRYILHGGLEELCWRYALSTDEWSRHLRMEAISQLSLAGLIP